MDNKNNFILSAVIAFAIYFICVFFFFYYTTHRDVKKIDAIKKTTVLQLDIVVKDVKENKKKLSVTKQSTTKEAAKVVKKSKSVSAKQRSDLKSLFANVKTKSVKTTKKSVMNVKKSSLSSRFKSKFEKEKKSQNIKVSKLVENKNINLKKIVVNESKNDNDPYFSKIYQLLSDRWQPTVFFNDLTAKVLIIISNNGTFSYQFIQYSDNIGFDTQLKQFLENETMKPYPVNPNNKTTEIEISFQSKGE